MLDLNINKNNLKLDKELSIGAILKQYRQINNIQISDISNLLKVKESDIIDLEKGNIHSSRSSIYIHGLIRSYGELLKIEPKLIKEKIKDLSETYNVKSDINIVDSKSNIHYFPDVKLTIYSIVILIILYMIVFYGSGFFNLETDLLIKDLIK